MPSNSEKQALMFYKAFHDDDYAASRKLKRENVVKVHTEDRAAGVFFDLDGKPTFDVNHPRSAEEMREDAAGQS